MLLTDGSAVLALVVFLSFAGVLFPPMCLRDHHRWMHTIDESLGNPPDAATMTVMLYSKIPLHDLLSNTTSSCYPRGRRNENGTTSRIDVALKAQMTHGYPLHPVSEVLPRRVFVVYGLESSGTTFTAKTIALALGIEHQNIQGDFVETEDTRDHVQHISLPFGHIKEGYWGYTTRFSEPLPMIPVLYPKPCQMDPVYYLEEKEQGGPTLQSPPKVCQDFMEDQVLTRPHRFFVNMTTHITWYRERGILVYPIMVVRDPALHMAGITDRRKGHTPDDAAAYSQYETGRAIMVETIEKGLNPIIVSYETMLTLQRPYICQLYETLGIETNFLPIFKNGNTKYLEQWNGVKWSLDPVELSLMREDDSPP